MRSEDNLRFIDTHAHIYLTDFESDSEAMVERFKKSGVERVYMPNIDLTSIDPMNKFAQKYPDCCFPMMGLHPCSVDDNFEKPLAEIEQKIRKETYYGVGEIGTDLYWEKKFWEQQQEAFLFQIQLAKELKLPAIIHCRETLDPTIDMVERLKDGNLKGIFHCFSGSVDQAKRITELGFYLGIGGVATFKNGGLDKVLPHIDLSSIVLETDSPYLAPIPHRGKRNEPSYIPLIAERISNICGVSMETISEITYKNAKDVFGL